MRSPQVQKYLKGLDGITDNLGKPVDADIKLSVATLQAHGFVTTASCSGHVERRTTGPYIWIESRESVNMMPKISKAESPTSGEYASLSQRIKESNLRERARILALLAEFYTDRKVSFLAMLSVEGKALERTRLACIGSVVTDALEDDVRHRKWLNLAQTEFAIFTDFLIAKL